MNEYIKWFLTNLAVLALFIGGIVYNLPFITTIAVVVYWITAIGAIGTYLLTLPATKLAVLVKDNLSESSHSVVSKEMDFLIDLPVVAAFLYFNYPILAIFYVLHMYSLWMSSKSLNV